MELPNIPPYFEGDDLDELRALQMVNIRSALQRLATDVERHYRNAWWVLGRPEDPVITCFEADQRFDPTILRPAFALLAAYWRKVHGRSEPSLPGLFPQEDRLTGWWRFLHDQVVFWALYEPRIIRKFSLAMVQGAGLGGQDAAADLLDDLMRFYDPDRAPNEMVEARI